MKKFYLFALAFLIFGGVAMAQTFTVDTEVADASPYVEGTLNPNNGWYNAKIKVTNTSNKAISINWQVLDETISEDWTYQICDFNLCWPIGQTEGAESELAIGAEGEFKVQFNSSLLPGNGSVTLQIWDVAQSADTSYDVVFSGDLTEEEINNVQTDIEDIDPAQNILVYPNPAISDLNVEITDNIGAGNIEIYDAVGKQVASKLVESTINTLDLSNLNEGLYFVRIISEDEDWVITKTFSKVN